MTFRLAVLALAVPLTAFAQQVPPLAGIAHVALRVHSLADSIAFYESLGYVQAFDLRRDNVPYESFIKINDRQFIELYPATAKTPDLGFLHLCFEGVDLQAIHDEYTSHGLQPTDVRKAGAGNLLFTLPGPLEPNGPGGKAIPQNIEYTQYMPGSLHSNDFGQHLGKDRIADTLVGVSINFIDPAAATGFYFNDLSFRPLPGEPQTLHLPGNSGEEIKIHDAALPPWLMLETINLAKAARRLSHEHIKFEKFPEALVFADPDGNQIVIRQK
jgi:catechol 2,3-dioxygenase-like lactoylglutathione lyase family enzyme